MQRKILIQTIVFAFAIKAFFLLYGAIVANAHWFSLEIFDLFRRNDSFWYERICLEGYPMTPPTDWEQQAFPFFPLYPVLVKGFMYIFGSFSVAAFVLSCFLTPLWVLAGFAFMRLYGVADKLIFRILLIIQIFPFHYFFHMYYTELLFSVLLLSSFWAMKRNRPYLLFLFTLLMALSRPTGVIFAAFLVPIFIHENNLWKSFFLPKNMSKFLPFFGGLFGIMLYMLFLHFYCGDALAFSHAQKAWGRGWYWPWDTMGNHKGVEFLFLWIWAFILFIVAIIAAWKAHLGEKIFIFGNVLFPLFTGNVISYYRYFSVIFPIFRNITERMQSKAFYIFALLLMVLNTAAYHYWIVNHGVLAY